VQVLELFLDSFWTLQHTRQTLKVLDFAAGSGEASQSILAWQRLRWPSDPSSRPLFKPSPVSSLPEPQLDLLASDPYTFENYTATTSRPCLQLSFQDVANHQLPEGDDFDLVICSYSLHLLSSSSELFAFLNTLKSRSRYLVVLAPHKLPQVCQDSWNPGSQPTRAQIKDSWGFARVHPLTLQPSINTSEDELISDKSRLRVYESAEMNMQMQNDAE
jgi:hypothetical protein